MTDFVTDPALHRAPPKGWPGLGMLPRFISNALPFLVEMRENHGDVVRYRFGRSRLIQLNHPKAIESLLLGHHKHCVKDQITRQLSMILGQGLLTSTGSHWKRQRKLAAPSLSARHIGTYADEMVAQTQRWLDSLPASSERDIHGEMMHLTLHIVVGTLFGTSQQLDATAVGGALHTFMAEFQNDTQGPRRLLPKWIPTPGRRAKHRAVQVLDDIVKPLVAERQGAKLLGDDLLSRLVAAQDEDGTRMSAVELRDEAITMFAAGHETTALVLGYTLHLLAHHPTVEKRLREELDAVIGGEAATLAHSKELPFTRAIIRESMRLYPPAWGIGREATEDFDFMDGPVKKGTQFFISPWVLHRDARFFDEPLLFRPERWMNGLFEQLPRMAYIPFGGGPRICIGNHFAMLESVLCLATIVQQLDLISMAKRDLDVVPSVTLRPKHPVMMKLQKRAS